MHAAPAGCWPCRPRPSSRLAPICPARLSVQWSTSTPAWAMQRTQRASRACSGTRASEAGSGTAAAAGSPGCHIRKLPRGLTRPRKPVGHVATSECTLSGLSLLPWPHTPGSHTCSVFLLQSLLCCLALLLLHAIAYALRCFLAASPVAALPIPLPAPSIALHLSIDPPGLAPMHISLQQHTARYARKATGCRYGTIGSGIRYTWSVVAAGRPTGMSMHWGRVQYTLTKRRRGQSTGCAPCNLRHVPRFRRWSTPPSACPAWTARHSFGWPGRGRAGRARQPWALRCCWGCSASAAGPTGPARRRSLQGEGAQGRPSLQPVVSTACPRVLTRGAHAWAAGAEGPSQGRLRPPCWAAGGTVQHALPSCIMAVGKAGLPRSRRSSPKLLRLEIMATPVQKKNTVQMNAST